MSKETDKNSFWFIQKNPISQEGVFPYSGKMIGDPSLDPNKLYNVYRPLEELEKAKDSFEGVPFIEGHEMIGDGGTPYDKRAAQGFLSNIVADGKKIYGDLKIWSESLKNKIEKGIKELSLGYRCTYEASKGVFNGKPYDFIQRNLIGNHLALVPEGRMGSEMRVYDSMTFDSIEIEKGEEMEKAEDEFISIEDFRKQYSKPEDLAWAEKVSHKRRKKETDDEVEVVPNKESKTGFIVKKVNNGKDMGNKEVEKNASDESVDKRKLIDEIGGILKSVAEGKEKMSEELIRTILGKVEESSYNGSEKSKGDDEEESEEKPENKEEGEDEEKSDEEAKDAEENGEKKVGCGMDASEMKKSILSTIRGMDKFYKAISPLTGEFAYDELESEEAMAEVACKKLKINSCGNARAAINGFLAAHKDVRFTLDSKESIKDFKSEAQKRLDSILK